MFDALRQRWKASRQVLPDDSPSTLDSAMSEVGSSLGDSEYGSGALTAPAPLPVLVHPAPRSVLGAVALNLVVAR